MLEFMAVSTFKEGVDMKEVLTHVEQEKLKVKDLQEQGRLGSVWLAVPQGKVFLAVFGEDESSAVATVAELPMAIYWDIEVFKLSGKA